MASCVFTREVWHRLLRTAGLQHLVRLGDSCMADWWQQTRAAIPKVFRKSFDSLLQGKNDISIFRAYPRGGGLLDRRWLSESRVADRHGFLAGVAGKLP